MKIEEEHDFIVDVCECGDLMNNHYDTWDYWVTGIKQGSGCKRCDCKHKQFSYTTSFNRYCSNNTLKQEVEED